MAKASSNQPNLLNQQKTVEQILVPLGWKRVDGMLNEYRLQHSDREYSYIMAVDELAEYHPEGSFWRAGRTLLDESKLVEERGNDLSKAATFQDALSFVSKLPSLVRPVFTPLEALRNLVLFHDGDSDFLAANRSLIADMPFGETSFEEALWQTARDVVTTQKPEGKK